MMFSVKTIVHPDATYKDTRNKNNSTITHPSQWVHCTPFASSSHFDMRAHTGGKLRYYLECFIFLSYMQA